MFTQQQLVHTTSRLRPTSRVVLHPGPTCAVSLPSGRQGGPEASSGPGRARGRGTQSVAKKRAVLHLAPPLVPAGRWGQAGKDQVGPGRHQLGAVLTGTSSAPALHFPPALPCWAHCSHHAQENTEAHGVMGRGRTSSAKARPSPLHHTASKALPGSQVT